MLKTKGTLANTCKAMYMQNALNRKVKGGIFGVIRLHQKAEQVNKDIDEIQALSMKDHDSSPHDDHSYHF